MSKSNENVYQGTISVQLSIWKIGEIGIPTMTNKNIFCSHTRRTALFVEQEQLGSSEKLYM
jgi:hypothetical protein